MDQRSFLKTNGLAATSTLLAGQSFTNSLTAGNRQVKPISGSWFEFTHGFAPEGKYWNAVLSQFTTEQWKAKVREHSEIGIEYLVLMAIANEGKTFYPSKLQPRYNYECPDPLEAVLWADIEIFEFEEDVYKSALIPADFERILKQMEDISAY